MQVYAIFQVSNPARVKAGVQEHYPDDYYIVGHDTFFVATQGETTRRVADKLGFGMKDSNSTNGIVIPVTNYWGRHDAELWEWISVKQATSGTA